MGQPINLRLSDEIVTEYLARSPKRQIQGGQDRAWLITDSDELEEQMSAIRESVPLPLSDRFHLLIEPRLKFPEPRGSYSIATVEIRGGVERAGPGSDTSDSVHGVDEPYLVSQ